MQNRYTVFQMVALVGLFTSVVQGAACGGGDRCDQSAQPPREVRELSITTLIGAEEASAGHVSSIALPMGSEIMATQTRAYLRQLADKVAASGLASLTPDEQKAYTLVCEWYQKQENKS